MTGPAHNGALIYSHRISELSRFYVQLFGMRVIKETTDLISLDRDGFNIVIHVPPFEMPENQFSAIKLFLSVPNIERAKEQAINLGGSALEGEWANPIFKVANIVDTDGNHIQIREFF